MDMRERMHDPEESFRAMLDGFRSSLWTAIPAVVQSVNMSKQTASLQPLIKSQQRMQDGSVKAVDLPLLNDVPMHFPGGGNASMTFPVAAGDEALVVFSSRPTDSWFQSGGTQNQVDARTHDLSDGFALVGFRSGPSALSSVSSDSTQIRSKDSKHIIDLHPGSGITVTSEAVTVGITPSGVTVAGGAGISMSVGGVSVSITSSGVAITGGTLTHNGNNIGSDHVHGGVEPGGSNTSGPH